MSSYVNCSTKISKQTLRTPRNQKFYHFRFIVRTLMFYCWRKDLRIEVCLSDWLELKSTSWMKTRSSIAVVVRGSKLCSKMLSSAADRPEVRKHKAIRLPAQTQTLQHRAQSTQTGDWSTVSRETWGWGTSQLAKPVWKLVSPAQKWPGRGPGIVVKRPAAQWQHPAASYECQHEASAEKLNILQIPLILNEA